MVEDQNKVVTAHDDGKVHRHTHSLKEKAPREYCMHLLLYAKDNIS